MSEIIQTYQPTLMEKLLGKNYKWWYLIKFENKIQFVYFWDNFFWIVTKLVIILTSLIIWKLNTQIKQTEILTYLLIGNIWLGLGETTISYRLGWDIFTGGITKILLLPQKTLPIYFIKAVGRNLLANFQATVILLVFVFFYRKYIILNTNHLDFLLFLFFISGFIILNLEIIAGLLSFWFQEISNFITAYRQIFIFLSGSLIPLDYLNFSNFLFLTPFAFTFYHPMQIYLGNYSPIETWYVFLGGLAWCFILYGIAKLVFKMGLKRNESVGL